MILSASLVWYNQDIIKVAIVHDYLKEYGGAERVVEALLNIFPDAPVYTAYLNLDSLGPHKERIKHWNIKTSWLQKMPFAGKLISPFRIFAPMIFEGFNLNEYDVVISSCAIYFSKAVITKPGSLHISYIHTPPRYLYGFTTSYNYKKNPITRILGELANHFLRIYDFETSQRPDILIANSKNVAARIKKFYRREASVIYPPVELSAISHQLSDIKKRQSEDRRLKTDSYFLSLSRLVRGKGVEVIIEACIKSGVVLKVAGTGPELKRLQKIAAGNKNIEFLGEVTDEERVKLYSSAKALIVAAEDEDFGITAVESQAAGTSVIAPRVGGFLETIIEKDTGMFFNEVSVDCLVQALEKFNEKDYDPRKCQKNAEKFSEERFREEILKLISNFQSSLK